MSKRHAFFALLAAAVLLIVTPLVSATGAPPLPRSSYQSAAYLPLLLKVASVGPSPTATPTATSTAWPTATMTPTNTKTSIPAVPTATPTQAQAAVCPCSSNSLNCSDFATQAQAQACFDYCWAQRGYDVHKLDRDNDGEACESLP